VEDSTVGTNLLKVGVWILLLPMLNGCLVVTRVHIEGVAVPPKVAEKVLEAHEDSRSCRDARNASQYAEVTSRNGIPYVYAESTCVKIF
jgi:hypothetical protein